eukprot:GHVL01025592.1.p1 GENE.GHVL01025592.1~~GHVL01025592.1.p1  ORF type:complete len:892 (+),score=207.06 GHVL01025592.1:49-2724(+)
MTENIINMLALEFWAQTSDMIELIPEFEGNTGVHPFSENSERHRPWQQSPRPTTKRVKKEESFSPKTPEIKKIQKMRSGYSPVENMDISKSKVCQDKEHPRLDWVQSLQQENFHFHEGAVATTLMQTLSGEIRPEVAAKLPWLSKGLIDGYCHTRNTLLDTHEYNALKLRDVLTSWGETSKGVRYLGRDLDQKPKFFDEMTVVSGKRRTRTKLDWAAVLKQEVGDGAEDDTDDDAVVFGEGNTREKRCASESPPAANFKKNSLDNRQVTGRTQLTKRKVPSPTSIDTPEMILKKNIKYYLNDHGFAIKVPSMVKGFIEAVIKFNAGGTNERILVASIVTKSPSEVHRRIVVEKKGVSLLATWIEELLNKKIPEESDLTLLSQLLIALSKLPIGLEVLKSVKSDTGKLIGKLVSKVSKLNVDMWTERVIQRGKSLENQWRERVQADETARQQKEELERKQKEEENKKLEKERAAKLLQDEHEDAERRRQRAELDSQMAILSKLANMPALLNNGLDQPTQGADEGGYRIPKKKSSRKTVSWRQEKELLEVVFFAYADSPSAIQAAVRSNDITCGRKEESRKKIGKQVDHKEGVALRETHINLEEIDDDETSEAGNPWETPQVLCLAIEDDGFTYSSRRGSESKMLLEYSLKYPKIGPLETPSDLTEASEDASSVISAPVFAVEACLHNPFDLEDRPPSRGAGRRRSIDTLPLPATPPSTAEEVINCLPPAHLAKFEKLSDDLKLILLSNGGKILFKIASKEGLLDRLLDSSSLGHTDPSLLAAIHSVVMDEQTDDNTQPQNVRPWRDPYIEKQPPPWSARNNIPPSSGLILPPGGCEGGKKLPTTSGGPQVGGKLPPWVVQREEVVPPAGPGGGPGQYFGPRNPRSVGPRGYS